MDFSLPEFVSDENSLGVFLLVSVAMGGSAAWLAGRAIAQTWRPWWHVIFYMLILALAVRFIHFALFSSHFLTPHYYLVDLVMCICFGLIGFRLMRVRQMVTRYKWLNQSANPFCWRRRESVQAAENRKI
jgi:hypothetical protein